MTLSRIALLCCALCVISQQLPSQPLIVYFGDSITEGWIEGERRPGDAYPARSDSLLREDGVSFRSLHSGAGGETTDDALDRIDTYILSVSPSVVVIAFGSNDMYVWDNPPAPRVPLSRFRDNIRLLIAKVRGIGARPLLLGMPPLIARRFYGAGADSTDYAPYGGARDMHDRYDRCIREVGREEECAVISLRDVFGMDASLMGFDGVHPLPGGHALIASVLAPVLADMLDRPTVSTAALRHSAWPNPFRPDRSSRCTIAFYVDRPQSVRITVLDRTGRALRKILYYAFAKGNHYVPWDGRGDAGTHLPAGAYTLYVRGAGVSFQHSILLM